MNTKLYAIIGCLLVFSVFSLGCEKKEEVKTVDWYMADENADALKAKLAECGNNPGELKDDPNCLNARTARHKNMAKPSKLKDWSWDNKPEKKDEQPK